jgi:hypothetical protein
MEWQNVRRDIQPKCSGMSAGRQEQRRAIRFAIRFAMHLANRIAVPTAVLGCFATTASHNALGQGTEERLPQAQLEFFESRIRPVLIEHCYECHSADSKIVQANLLVDTKAGLIQGGDSGPSLVPNQPDQSPLLKALLYEDSQMPPKGKLSDEIINDFRKWIAQGAIDPRTDTATRPERPWIDPAAASNHWAFQPLKPLQSPSAAQPSESNSIPDSTQLESQQPVVSSSNRIDLFVEATLQKKGMLPGEQADAMVLLRRITFDLTGLPPTLEDAQRYLNDPPAQRYELLVDRLLASPQYGVRWARHWLDSVRYANSNGADENHDMPNAWRYRDWVVDALNEDLSFDAFVRHQIAGDLLPTPEDEVQRNRMLTATGFWVLGPKMLAEQDKAKMQIDIVDEQIDTFSRTMLGVTLSCARCHDHKFDPFTQKDYFALAGVLMSTRTMADQAFVSNWMERELPTQARHEQRAVHQTKIDDATQTHHSLLMKIHQELLDQGKLPQLPENNKEPIMDGPYSEEMKKQIEESQKQLESLQKATPAFDRAMAVEEAKMKMDMPVHLRGNHLKPSEERVPRGVPKILADAVVFPTIPPDQSGRMQLADWLTNPQHPLLARVMVNRIWMWHFGQPLVSTPSNFGLKGEAPSHPELLDDLASRWIEQGWSLKWLHREIVTSKSYRRTSRDARYEESDPENRWLWKQNERRLEMEPIRDSLLACSSRLDARLGPPIPGEGPRRSIYLNINRAALDDLFSVFDYVDPASHIEQRPVTTVPSQALFFLNNPIVSTASETLGEQIAKKSKDDGESIDQAFRNVLGRAPSSREIDRSLSFLQLCVDALAEQAQTNPPTGAPVDKQQYRTAALSALIHGLFSTREFIWIE